MIIGTAGHIDHGKTSLVRALTGVDTDRLKEEKARGISIDLGFAYLACPDGSVIGFVDVPGHERFIHNMLAGATGIDFVLLVVAADDAVMPQTLEHLAIVDLLGIERGAVVLTKSDLADASRRADVVAQIRRTLEGTGLAAAPVLPASTVTGEGVDELRAHLIDAVGRHGAHAQAGRFRLAVDRCFTLAGAGTIVTGTVLSGAVCAGDHVVVSPSGLPARVRAIHAQNRPVERARTGERCALNLTGDGVNKDAIRRGDVVLDPGLHAPTERIDAVLRVLSGEPRPVGQWMPARLHHAAAETGARIVVLGDQPLRPGEEGFVQLVLERPIAATVGDRFVLRDTSAQRTIGGGRFLDLRAPARKRRTAERVAQLAAHAVADPGSALAALVDLPPHHVDIAGFARDRALAAPELETIVASLALVEVPAPTGTLALSSGTFAALRRSLVTTLETFHAEHPQLPGIGVERLRLVLAPKLPAPAFRVVLQRLAAHDEAALDGAWVRLPSHQARLTPKDEKLWTSVKPLLAGAQRFRPPRVRDLAGMTGVAEAEMRRVLKLVGRMGKVDEVAHDHFFLRATVAEMVKIAEAIGADGTFTAAQFRDRLDNGRKVAIQILEFFDRHGVMLRRGDLRRINKHRLDLFSPPADEARAGDDSRTASADRPGSRPPVRVSR